MELIRLDLIDADPREVMGHLVDQGITCQVYKEVDGLHIVTDVDATAAMSTFSASASAPFADPLPPVLRAHVTHLKDFRNAVRAGQTVTTAQTTHVIADIIDVLRFLNARTTGDD